MQDEGSARPPLVYCVLLFFRSGKSRLLINTNSRIDTSALQGLLSVNQYPGPVGQLGVKILSHEPNSDMIPSTLGFELVTFH